MRVKIHPSFVIYLSCISMLSSFYVCMSILAALLVHELAHYTICRILNEQIDQLVLTPVGGIMTYKRGTVSSKGIKGVCIHAAGPVGNYAALLLISYCFSQSSWNPALIRSLIVANLSMLLLNFLPVLPLDGGHIVFCLGYYVFPVSKLICCLSASGMLIGCSGLLLTLYGILFRGILNCSLLIVSVHLIFCAKKQNKSLIAENIYTVVQERMMRSPNIRRLVLYQIPSDTRLIDLVSYLKQGVSVSFVFTMNHNPCKIDEYVLCQLLLTSPFSTVLQAYQSGLHHEKNEQNLENASFIPCNIAYSDIQ